MRNPTLRTRQPNRPTPLMRSQDYKTFAIRQPIATHFRPATCEEVDCQEYKNGWMLRIDQLEPIMQHTARNCGRSFREMDLGENGTVLVYEAGQPCMRASTHQVPLDRPALFIVGRGDWRTFSASRARRHASPENWRDDFAEHLDKIHAEIAKG